MVLVAGKMYRPTGIVRHSTSAYIVEHYNHRVSKWNFLPTATPPANFVFTLDAGQLTSITITNAGTGYAALDPVVISAPTLNIADPVNATAVVATVGGSGDILTFTITNPGNGYDPNNLPTVVADETTGSGAILAAVVSIPWGTNNDGTTGGPGQAVSTTDNFFNFPTGIARDPDENKLFVADTLNHRIRVITLSTGVFEDSIGTPGTGDGELYRPTYLDLATNNSILAVADSRNHRVSTFDLDTPFAFLANATPPAEGFHTPNGVKHNIDNTEFYYSDLIRGKLYTYSDTDGITPSTPTSIGTPGTDPSTPNELFYPGSASGGTGTSGESYLTDTRNNKIKKFTEPGVVSDVLTVAGTGDGEFYYPADTFGFDESGSEYLLVANTLNHRIEVYDRTDDSFQNTFGTP